MYEIQVRDQGRWVRHSRHRDVGLLLIRAYRLLDAGTRFLRVLEDGVPIMRSKPITIRKESGPYQITMGKQQPRIVTVRRMDDGEVERRWGLVHV